MDKGSINRIVSDLIKLNKINVSQIEDLKNVLHYIYKDGVNKFRNGKLYKSDELTYQGDLLTSNNVLTEFVNELERSKPERVNDIINHYKNKLAYESQQAQQRRNERKSSRSSMLSANRDRKIAEHSFNRGAKRQRESENDEDQQKIGGKRTKHKRHNPKKTRRRYK